MRGNDRWVGVGVTGSDSTCVTLFDGEGITLRRPLSEGVRPGVTRVDFLRVLPGRTDTQRLSSLAGRQSRLTCVVPWTRDVSHRVSGSDPLQTEVPCMTYLHRRVIVEVLESEVQSGSGSKSLGRYPWDDRCSQDPFTTSDERCRP